MSASSHHLKDHRLHDNCTLTKIDDQTNLFDFEACVASDPNAPLGQMAETIEPSAHTGG